MRVVADVECERGDLPVTWRIGMGESASLVLSNEALAARRWALCRAALAESSAALCANRCCLTSARFAWAFWRLSRRRRGETVAPLSSPSHGDVH